jgi:hypothetical protein
MKNFFLAILFFYSTVPSIHGQTRTVMVTPTPAVQTCIRSVVAQGGELAILLHVGEAGAYELDIYSPDGQIVYQQTLREQIGEVEHRITFGARTHGVYVVNLVGAGVQSTRQVMW